MQPEESWDHGLMCKVSGLQNKETMATEFGEEGYS